MGPAACSVGKSRHTAASYAASYSPLAGAVSSAWLSIDGQTVGRCSMLSLRCTNLPRRSNVGSVGQPPLTAACTPLRERPAQPLPPPLWPAGFIFFSHSLYARAVSTWRTDLFAVRRRHRAYKIAKALPTLH